VNSALAGLIRRSQGGTKGFEAVKSAVDAGEIARNYLTSTAKLSGVTISEISYNHANEVWEVEGRNRSNPLTRSQHFELEIRGEDGAILTFRSTSTSSILFGLALVALLSALGVVALMLYGLLAR
jgi:hypothetical protein